LPLPSPVRGEEKPAAPWWETETALAEDGTLILTGKPWWKRAAALKVGEHFTVKSEYPGGGRMLVRREQLTRGGKTFEAVVWVIDDDGDLQPGQTDGDKDSDCYVADYGCDGRVDRMVDYIDNDGDGKPDELDIRYFHGGQLRISWFGMDLDNDGRMWSMKNYEYWGGFFRSDPYGDNMIYANKYDPKRRQWVPISECPFAFYDTDGDGESEAVVRVSAVPLNFDPKKELDPGNSLFSYNTPFQERMRNIGAVNVRYSIDLDNLSGPERRLHYDLGFNLIGRLPYKFEGMEHTNPLRRSPKTTIVIPYKSCRQVAETYPAEQTGFSWHEYGDDATTQGFGPHAKEDRRWEGIFWTWNRRIMHNTGGPIRNWNMRREFQPTPSKKRELYYSRVDRRIHLKGATEGWIRVGHLGDPKSIWGEIRMFDTNGDGYFDRWETYRAGAAAPVRVGTVAEAGIRDLPDDWEKLHRFYTRELLPEALAANEKLISAMRPLDKDFKAPEYLAKALKAAACDGEKRYVQDIIRESQYLALRDKLAECSAKLLAASSPKSDGISTADRRDASARAWTLARTISNLDAAYAEGRYDDAVRILSELAELAVGERTPGKQAAPSARFTTSFTNRLPIRIDNTGGRQRDAWPIVLSVKTIQAIAKDFNPDNCAVVAPGRRIDRPEAPHQIDRIDEQVGRELSFLADVPADAKATYYLYYSPTGKRNKQFARKTGTCNSWDPPADINIGWESTLIAYRTYDGHFDFFGKYWHKNGKNVQRLVYPIRTSHHAEQPWGIDALHVNDTSGLGGLTLYLGDRSWVVRNPGCKGDLKFTRRMLTAGPVRAAVEIRVDNVIPDKPDLSVRYVCIIYAEHQESEIRVAVDGAVDGAPADMLLAPGLTKLTREKRFIDKSLGCLGTWGHQDDIIGEVGVGLIVPPEKLKKVVELPGETRLLCENSDGTLCYWIIGDWRRGRRFPVEPTVTDWRRRMQSLGGLLHRNVEVTLGALEKR
jgi:hypothetical protein